MANFSSLRAGQYAPSAAGVLAFGPARAGLFGRPLLRVGALRMGRSPGAGNGSRRMALEGGVTQKSWPAVRACRAPKRPSGRVRPGSRQVEPAARRCRNISARLPDQARAIMRSPARPSAGARPPASVPPRCGAGVSISPNRPCARWRPAESAAEPRRAAASLTPPSCMAQHSAFGLLPQPSAQRLAPRRSGYRVLGLQRRTAGYRARTPRPCKRA